jgi:hypothetical protein
MNHISAKDLFISDVNKFKQEGPRVSKIFQKLPGYPLELRERLRDELLEIACNQSEIYSIRNQAISILGLWSRPLNAVGRSDISKMLLRILDAEFISANKRFKARQVNQYGSSKGLQKIYLRSLLIAILLIHPKNEWAIPKSVCEIGIFTSDEIDEICRRTLHGGDASARKKPQFGEN